MNNELLETSEQIETQYLISTNKFIILSVLTFGLYEAWWFYKSWRFFQQKENKDLAPAMRTIFGIFYLIPLFNRIKFYAIRMNYEKSYYSGVLLLGYIVCVLFSYLSFPGSIISNLTVLFLIPPFNALNFAKRNSENIIVIEQSHFSTKQIILIVIGGLLWLFNIYYVAIIQNSNGL